MVNQERVQIIEDSGRTVAALMTTPWLLLIVDDDESVHSATRFALQGFTFEGRELRILSAYSASQARQVIASEDDIAVVLLDVVMESVHGGLDLVRWIRDDLSNNHVRIVLRTGQPGFAPEMQVVRDYDINDYKEKGEMTAAKLATSVYAALRSFRDIVRLEVQAERLHHALAAAEAANRAKTDFITHMSHEFRTPLNGILGLSEMIAAEILGPVGNPKYKEYAWDIVSSGKRLQVLLEGVLELTESGDDKPLDFDTFDLRSLIGEFLASKGRDEGVMLETTLPGVRTGHRNDWTLHADRRAVRTMLTNLVSNALNHNPPNCRVRITARQFRDGRFTLSVIDDGIGIDPEVLGRLGDPFNLDGNPYVSGQGGLGLGLVATKKLIERHGGSMSVESAPGRGTTVRLTFPNGGSHCGHPTADRLLA